MAPGFRVMSYNILADQYAGTAYAQQVLFDYCPTELLDNQYRRQLVLQEVIRYQPDILCLQEVDDKVFAEYLLPHLLLEGYEGCYTNKQGKVREGSAMFWRTSRFRALAKKDVLLRDVFAPPLGDLHQQFSPLLDNSPNLVDALQKVTTIAQMVLLLPADSTSAAAPAAAAAAGGGRSRPLLVTNTHLFFHPYAPHIRTIHTAAVLEEAQAALQEWQSSSSSSGGMVTEATPTPSVAAGGVASPAAAAVAGGGASAAAVAAGGLTATATAAGEGEGGGSLPATASNAVAAAGGGSDGEKEANQQQQQQQQQQQSGLVVFPPACEVAGLLSGCAAASVMFCGDLNSDLNDGVPGVVELLRSGRLPADHWDWKEGLQFRWGLGEEDYQEGAEQNPEKQHDQQQQQPTKDAAVAAATTPAATEAAGAAATGATAGTSSSPSSHTSYIPLKDGHDFDPPASSPSAPVESPGVIGLDLVAPYTLASADDLKTPYTNYTSGYKALLDYVWYQRDHWQVVGQLPQPTPEQMAGFVPNARFPSDHLAVVYDFQPRLEQA